MDKISSGVISLDLSLNGGIPLDKITEICGPPNSSKTSFVLNMIKQNEDCVTAYLDIDNTINMNYLETLGIDIDSLVIAHPQTSEQLVQITEELIASGSVDIIVVDSIASLISNEDLNSSMKKQSNNSTITDTIKKLSNLMYKSNCALVLINQVRNDLKSTKYNSEIAIADRALNTYASVRLDVRQTNELHKYDQIIGAKVKITIKKNKLALKKGNDVFVKHYYDSGIDIIDDLLELACNAEIVSRTGSWYTYDKVKLQGKPSMKNYLIRNEDVLDDIFERVLNHYFKD